MKNKKVYTEEEMFDLLNEIRKKEPTFSHSEETLEAILKFLPDKPSRVQKRHFNWWKTASNIAAVFLLGLFVFQQVKDSVGINEMAENKSFTVFSSSEKNAECNFTDEYARLHPREVLLCYVKTNTRKPSLYEKLKKSQPPTP